jgi:hypothetical protein
MVSESRHAKGTCFWRANAAGTRCCVQSRRHFRVVARRRRRRRPRIKMSAAAATTTTTQCVRVRVWVITHTLHARRPQQSPFRRPPARASGSAHQASAHTHQPQASHIRRVSELVKSVSRGARTSHFSTLRPNSSRDSRKLCRLITAAALRVRWQQALEISPMGAADTLVSQ